MALNENLHIINGTLGKDAETRITQTGKTVCNVSVATSHWDGQANVTTWHRCTILGRQAEYIGQYGKKGGEIACKGRVQTREYTDKDGQKRRVTETICFDAELPKVGNQGQQSQGSNEYAKQKGRPAQQAPTGGSSFDDMDDDIPF